MSIHDPFPVGEPECKYGRQGAWGRAARDAWGLWVSNPVAAVVVVLSVAVSGAVGFVVTANDSVPFQAFTVVEGVLAGLVIGLLIVWGWALTPMGKREHWRLHIVPMEPNSAHPLGAYGLNVETMHYHRLSKLLFRVRDPHGVERSASLGMGIDWVRPGQTTGAAYPADFDAPNPPEPGTYRVTVEAHAPDMLVKPVVVGRVKWKVPATP